MKAAHLLAIAQANRIVMDLANAYILAAATRHTKYWRFPR